MQLLVADGQPDPSPTGEMRGLGDLRESQEVDEEPPGSGLRTRGSAELHMVDSPGRAEHRSGTAVGYKNRPRSTRRVGSESRIGRPSDPGAYERR